MAGESRMAVLAAIVGNLAIAAIKLVAAVLSGSASMLAEGIHSLVDTGNGTLMLHGMHSSRRPPDEAHPLGYGHELYFWTLIVGVLIFGLGGGMSMVTGVVHIVHGTPAEDAWWSYAVLGAAAVFEGISWYFGYRAFRTERRGRGVVATIRHTKNPTSFAVLLEDSAALLGLVFAFFGIFLSSRLGAPWIDGAFSVLIGVLLCGIAIVMVYESKGLLVGEGMDEDALAELRAIVDADPRVCRVERLLTMYLGPDEVLLAIALRAAPDIRIAELRRAIARIKREIRRRYPRIRRIYLDTASIHEPPPAA
jgi:cation diffusion facilitator family transporter